MKEDIEKRGQKIKDMLHQIRQKLVTRNWNLASRLNPKQIRKEGKKKGD